MAEQGGRNGEREPEPAHRSADRIIVGKLVREGVKAADAPQRFGAERDRGAEAGVGPASCRERHWAEMVVDHPLRNGTRCRGADAAIEAGRRPTPGFQRADETGEIAGIDKDIAVGQNDNVAVDRRVMLTRLEILPFRPFRRGSITSWTSASG